MASGEPRAVLAGRRLVIAPRVHAEVLFVYTDASRSTRTVIDNTMLQIAGVHHLLVELSDGEREAAVRFAHRMDDGEAETLAVATMRAIPVLSDDAAVAQAVVAIDVQHETSLDLLEAWGRQESIKPGLLRAAALSMRDRANYAPPRAHRLRTWYFDLTRR